jgi:hypothetical protein
VGAFDDPDLGVFSSHRVMDRDLPVLLVFHDENGDWEFLSSYEESAEEIVLVHVSHLLEFDPSLQRLADLPAGWKAWRESATAEWIREPTPANQPTLDD